MPKGVAVRIRARASKTGARPARAPSLLASHCSSGVELSIRNRAVVGSNPTSGSFQINDLHTLPQHVIGI